jgi:hypothetical protein
MATYAGVVDQPVNPWKLVEGAVEQAMDIVPASHIRLPGDDVLIGEASAANSIRVRSSGPKSQAPIIT